MAWPEDDRLKNIQSRKKQRRSNGSRILKCGKLTTPSYFALCYKHAKSWGCSEVLNDRVANEDWSLLSFMAFVV